MNIDRVERHAADVAALEAEREQADDPDESVSHAHHGTTASRCSSVPSTPPRRERRSP